MTGSFAEWRHAARAMLPSRGDYDGLSRSWRGDLVAGVTVGIVALPLALGFGVASGVGATAGIVTAIVAGIVAAVFGGSSVQVSGPTGAMAVVLVPVVARDGVGAVATVAILAGVLVLLMSVLGIGRMIQFVPWSVLEGFTVGIAATIALQQVPLLVGFPHATGTGVLDSAWVAVRTASWSALWPTLLLGLVVVLVMIGLPRVTRRVPASIVAVVVATTVSLIAGFSVPSISSLPDHLPLPHVPSFDLGVLRHLAGPALAVAVLAAMESLLSARVADAMTGRARCSDGRELFGQGLANIAVGFFGGMPATGAIARTAVNVRSGARTRLAAIIHSLVIVVIIMAMAPLVRQIPLAVLGGVLVVTAVKMVNHVRVRRVLRAHAAEAITFGLTAIVTVAVNLITAIEVGIIVAGVLALREMAKGSGAVQEDLAVLHDGPIEDEHLLAEHIAVFRLDGALFFGAAPRFEQQLASIEGCSVVILRLKGLSMIDASGAEALAWIITDLEAKGVTVLVKGARSEHSDILASAGILAALEARGHLFDDLEAATAHAHLHVRRDRSYASGPIT